jgi:hypothetical protein
MKRAMQTTLKGVAAQQTGVVTSAVSSPSMDQLSVGRMVDQHGK